MRRCTASWRVTQMNAAAAEAGSATIAKTIAKTRATLAVSTLRHSLMPP